MTPEPLLLAVVFSYGTGALAAIVVGGAVGRGLVAGCALLAALSGVMLGVICLGAEHAPTVSAPFLPLTSFSLRIDGLSAFFLILIGIVGAAVSVYGFGYSAAYEGRYSLRLLGAMLNILLLSLSVQVMADNALTFLVAWEAMSLSAYLMVLTEHDRPGTLRAAHWYIAITHASFAALVGMFLLLSAGDLTTSFSGMRSALLTPGVRNAAFVLALFGFGAKAGIVPLHVWLPMAHPVAPSHVSALMSGVVIKMGIYGLVRVTIDLLVGGPSWWGGLVLGIGTVSALLGVLYALMEHDLKRLLAFHSVENIGIIFIGLGAGLLFQSYGLTTLATLSVVGGLYHTLNHACFKGLLFLGAGSVLHATGTRNMEELGGLVKRMPRTAFFFLVGACAISALPPLHRFGRGLLRKGLRDHVPRHPTDPGGRARPREPGLHASRDAHAGRGMRGPGVSAVRDRPAARIESRRAQWLHGQSGGIHSSPAASGAGNLRADVGTTPGGRARGAAHPRPPGPSNPGCRPAATGRRHVGLRPDRPNATHAIHRHRLCRAAAACLCRALPADSGLVHRLPPRVQVLCPVDRVPQ